MTTGGVITFFFKKGKEGARETRMQHDIDRMAPHQAGPEDPGILRRNDRPGRPPAGRRRLRPPQPAAAEAAEGLVDLEAQVGEELVQALGDAVLVNGWGGLWSCDVPIHLIAVHTRKCTTHTPHHHGDVLEQLPVDRPPRLRGRRHRAAHPPRRRRGLGVFDEAEHAVGAWVYRAVVDFNEIWLRKKDGTGSPGRSDPP